ncbi:ABC transporter ATP-binding protein [Gluconacetobacter sacchari DSM 12717]|uniref:ABC transporter ATP-binding protein n=2 Tax=Gluconacetobacter sacchari TaxID=92759 RepID=A0A7W4IBM0_9PROT|nr:ABC transporter ATP-binding protein [Gluconacetobacter sacchari]MBB2159757.1 ABC transporter ATP-binding protein [Gluconacetobacter sacchari]GBQ23508.1 ABC transporter ATP-binding protein [Gluconacetobacter sacchari DSM 12717]
MPDPEIPVEISHLRKVLGGRPVLDDLSLTLRPGEITALLGPNGAGKTTLIGCLLGLLSVDGGTVRLWGEDATSLRAETRARIGFVPQTMTGFTWFRVGELMAYLSRYRARPDDTEDRTWEDWAALDPRARIKTLSGGERQRLAIVLALRFRPDLIVLDEPVASLDPQARYDFMRLLPAYARRSGASVLISSHIISDLQDTSDRFIMMRHGQVMLDMTAREIAATVRRLSGPPDAGWNLDVIAAPGAAPGTAQGAEGVWVRGWHPALDAAAAAAGHAMLPGDIERLFLALTR